MPPVSTARPTLNIRVKSNVAKQTLGLGFSPGDLEGRSLLRSLLQLLGWRGWRELVCQFRVRRLRFDRHGNTDSFHFPIGAAHHG